MIRRIQRRTACAFHQWHMYMMHTLQVKEHSLVDQEGRPSATSISLGGNTIQKAAREAREHAASFPPLAPINIALGMHGQKPSLTSAPTPTLNSAAVVAPRHPGQTNSADFAAGNLVARPHIAMPSSGAISESPGRSQSPGSRLMHHSASEPIHFESAEGVRSCT
jgi:hypothetical protein